MIYEGLISQVFDYIDLTHSRHVKLEIFQDSLKFYKGVRALKRVIGRAIIAIKLGYK